MTLMWLQRGKWWELFECGWLQCDCKGVIDENCLRVDDFSVTAKGIIDENCFGVEDFDVITKGVIDENCLRVEYWYDYKEDN